MSNKEILESDRVRDHDIDDPDAFSYKVVQKPGENVFVIECSDDENYEISTVDMIAAYKRIAEGDFELSQKLVRVRSPSPDQMEEKIDEVNKNDQDRGEEVAEEKSVAEEFDFDNFTETSKVMTPRRNIGSIKAPRNTQKRVAQWDKIMNDYLKYQKLEGEKTEPAKELNLPLSSTISASLPISTTAKCTTNIAAKKDVSSNVSFVDPATSSQYTPKFGAQEIMEVNLSEEDDIIKKRDL